MKSIKGRLRLLVESESLLNDGVAAVLFALSLIWAQGASQDATALQQIAQALTLTAGGGITPTVESASTGKASRRSSFQVLLQLLSGPRVPNYFLQRCLQRTQTDHRSLGRT